MKIHGAEGLLPENIRDEVNRGGRLVIHMYCVSILVMTFKRASGVRLVKAGHSPAWNGLPFTLISLFCGWWGFPWGPVYTIETMYRNLSGGIDVTDEVLKALLPAAARTAAPASTTLTTASARKFNPTVAVLMAGGAAALIAGGLAIYCQVQVQNLTVVLASGLDRPYAVTLNGVTHRLGAHGSEVIKLSEGDFVLQDAEGGTIVGPARTLGFTAPLFSHLDSAHVAIINPDRTAVFSKEDVPYYKDGSTPSTPEDASFALLANQQSYFIEKPDFVLETATQRISMPSGTTRLVKTRLDLVKGIKVQPLTRLIAEKLGYPAAREHLMIQTRFQAGEDILSAAMEILKPEDHRAFFLTRLAERPVLVEWHRYYQQSTILTHPQVDLGAEYRGYLQANPADGALLYLLGRMTTNRSEATQLFQQALDARPPCPYAHAAFGYDALCDGQFADALRHFLAAEKAGVGGTSRTRYRQQAYWGLHQFETLLAEVRAARKSAPDDLLLAADEISALLASGQGEAAGRKIRTDFVAALKAANHSDKSVTESGDYLQAVIAYQTGQLPAYAELVSHFHAPTYDFRAAVTRGELAPATKVLLAEPNPQSTDVLLLYLLAKRTGDEAAAEKHFARAQELMRHESSGFKQAALLLESPVPPPPEKLCDVTIDASDKCVFLTAMGLKDPAHQAVYHAAAARLDFMPDFPHQLLRDFLKPAGPSSL